MEPASTFAAAAARAWSDALGGRGIRPEQNFFALGGDSLLAIHVNALLAREGHDVPPTLLFTTASFEEFVDEALGAASAVANRPLRDGPEALLPDEAWYLNVGRPVLPDPGWVEVSVLDLDPAVSMVHACEAVRVLWATHDALRLHLPAGTSRLGTLPAGEPPFEVIDGTGDFGVLTHKAVAETTAGIDVATGPLARWCLVESRDGRRRLIFAGQFLTADHYSVRMLTDDLDAILRQLVSGGPGSLPSTTSARQWATMLHSYAAGLPEPSGSVLDAVRSPGLGRVTDDGDLPNTEGTAGYCELPIGDARKLAVAAAAAGSSLYDLLSAVIMSAFLRWSGRDQLSFYSVLTGRNLLPHDQQPDLSRVVGRLAMSALHVVSDPGAPVRALAAQIRDSRRAGEECLLKAWMDPASGVYRAVDRDPDILFSFIGHTLTSPLRLVRPADPAPARWFGVDLPSDLPRFVKFEVEIADYDDAFTVALTYPGRQVDASRLEELLGYMRDGFAGLGLV